jgi:outer membrane protein assembly factor BamB/tRNA A-37 threonylcarbamoyl transferase component Bud32
MSNPNDTRHIESDPAGPLAVPDGTLQPGQVLQSRYRILGIVGMGGMGAVYQARDLHFPTVPRLVAVKEMINMAQDQQFREQTMKNFEREAEILATLNHPAIPQIYDFFSFGDRAYLIMEFIQGKDLEAILNSTESFLPVEQVRQWAIEICDVLAYLHNHEPEPIVFRDMKPSNVMIDHHKRVRLIDFGIAKTFQMGQPGTMIGTDGYAAPEQYKGLASPAADIYALGATLHHLLTRRDPRLEPPFSFHKRPIKDSNSNVPEALASIVMRSLSYDPEDRYASAQTMKQSIEAIGGNNGAVAVAPAPSTVDSVPQQAAPAPAAYPAPAENLKARGEAVSIVQQSTVTPIWSFQVEDAVRSTPVVHNDILYVGSYDNNLWALDVKDGSLVWKFATEGGIGSSPAYSGGTVFIGSSDRRMHAVDARTGNRKWMFKTEGKIYTTPEVAVGLVFFGSDDGFMYALKPGPTSAREMWSFNIMSPIRSSPRVADDNLYFGTEAGEFMCMDVSGELLWRFETRRRIMSTPFIHEHMVYIGSDDWYVYALDVEQGYPNWRFRTRGAVVSSPVVAGNICYFGSADGFIYAVDALGGRETWKYEVGKAVTSTPCIYGDALYIGATDGGLYCLHAQTGDLLWRYQSNGPIISSPHVADDVVYVGSDDKHIYALQA